MLAPLYVHFDSGLGATAEAFFRSAHALKEKKPKRAMHDHLPVSYLYRHAIELFLKAVIIIFHRRFEVLYGSENWNGDPMIPVKGNLISIHRVHGVGVLYADFKALHATNLEKLREAEPDVNLQNLPDGLEKEVLLIEADDPSSTLYRYPKTQDEAKDKEKSGFQDKTAEVSEMNLDALRSPLRLSSSWTKTIS